MNYQFISRNWGDRESKNIWTTYGSKTIPKITTALIPWLNIESCKEREGERNEGDKGNRSLSHTLSLFHYIYNDQTLDITILLSCTTNAMEN